MELFEEEVVGFRHQGGTLWSNRGTWWLFLHGTHVVEPRVAAPGRHLGGTHVVEPRVAAPRRHQGGTQWSRTAAPGGALACGRLTNHLVREQFEEEGEYDDHHQADQSPNEEVLSRGADNVPHARSRLVDRIN